VRGESGGHGGEPEPPVPQQAIFEAREEIAAVTTPEPMEDYVVALVSATRRPDQLDEELGQHIQVGVSPRGSLALDRCSRAHAWMEGRDVVTPDDIRAVAHDCLRHRIKASFEAQADGVTSDELISRVVELVAVA
jgi:MoxR-like ATPase